MAKSDIPEGGFYRPRNVGKSLYVWTYIGLKTADRTEEAMISAHGCAAMSKAFKIPDGMTIYFYGPHGYTLQDPGAVSMSTGQLEPNEWYGAAKGNQGKKCPDYYLSKYQGRHSKNKKGKASETYEDLAIKIHRGHVLEVIKDWAPVFKKRALDDTKDCVMDVVTVRNRWYIGPLGSVRLSRIVARLEKSGFKYKSIHCSFCRGGIFSSQGTWDARTGQAVAK